MTLKKISQLPLGRHVTNRLVSKQLFLNLSYFLFCREKLLLSLPTVLVMAFCVYCICFKKEEGKKWNVSSFLLVCARIVYPKEKCKAISIFHVFKNQHLQRFLVQGSSLSKVHFKTPMSKI